MDDRQQRRNRRRFIRLRTLKTNNPFCRVCGKSDWWVRYERHHIDGRRLLPDMIFICWDCHNEVGEMNKDHDPLPRDTDPSVAALIHRLEGQNDLAAMQIEHNGRTIAWLKGRPLLPPPPPDAPATANDRRPRGRRPGGGSAVDPMAELERKFGQGLPPDPDGEAEDDER